MMEDEDGNEEDREDVPALKDRTVPAPAPEEDGGGSISAGDTGGERRDASMDLAAGKLDREVRRMAEADSPVPMEEPERDGAASAEERPNEDQLVWRLEKGSVREGEAVWRQALTDRLDGISAEAARTVEEGTAAETMRTAAEAARMVEEGTAAETMRTTAEAARMAAEGTAESTWGETAWGRLGVEQGGGPERMAGREAGSGLEGLYRRTVQAGRPAPQVLSVEQAGQTFHAEEPGRTAALTVDELDRAVRRDSRRYDGGMMLY